MAEIITVESIVRKALLDMGADGLCYPDAECGCGLNDFHPCEERGDLCQPGYLKRCEKCGMAAYFPSPRTGPWVCEDCEEVGRG